MLDKNLTFHLFIFQLSVVVAILKSVSSDQTVHCSTKKKPVTLYKKNITVYQVVRTTIQFFPNQSDIRLKSASSQSYNWTVDAFEKNVTYKWKSRRAVKRSSKKQSPTTFTSWYKKLHSTINERYDGAVRLRYRVRLKDSTIFYSETATLRIGALPKISKPSNISWRNLGSRVETCFNVTGTPKPSLKIYEQVSNAIMTSANKKENCVYFNPKIVNDAETITVTAENCFGKYNITIKLPNFQNTLNTETLKSNTPTVSTSNASNTLKLSSQSAIVSSYFTGATTKSAAATKGNTTTSGFPVWASAIIAIFSIAALILLVFLITFYVRKKRSSRAASQESKNHVLEESEPTVYAMPMKKRAVVSPFIKESATVTAERQPSMVLANVHPLDSSPTNPTECLLYSNLSQAETNMASQGVKPDESELRCEEDAQAMYATPVKSKTANSQPEIKYDNTLTVTQKSSQEGYDVAAPHITHSTARSSNTRHDESAAASPTLEYAELQFGNNPVGPAVSSSAAVTYASIKT